MPDNNSLFYAIAKTINDRMRSEELKEYVKDYANNKDSTLATLASIFEQQIIILNSDGTIISIAGFTLDKIKILLLLAVLKTVAILNIYVALKVMD